MKIPAKVQERLVAGVKKFQPIVQKAKDKDVNESDTVTIISDILCEVFGYDKYSEITSEFAIKKTFCDLAIEIDGKVALLIEAKAAGLALKDDFVRQAVDYGANAGIDWVVLTNSVSWKIFKISFAKPVDKELVYEFAFCDLNHKKQADLEMLFYLCKEAIAKASTPMLFELAALKQNVNSCVIGQLCLTDPILDAVRKQLKKMSPEAKVTNEDIYDIMMAGVLKREVFDGDKSEDAKKRIKAFERSQTKKEPVKESE